MNKLTKKQKKLGASFLAILIAIVLALATGKDIGQVVGSLFATGSENDSPDADGLNDVSKSLTPAITGSTPDMTVTSAADAEPDSAGTPTLTAEAAATQAPTAAPTKAPAGLVEEDGVYSTPELVAAYLHTFHRLPSNFITKNEAAKLGWVNSEGNLWDVTDEMSIGGDKFGNYEGLLPKADGRQWYECDVNYYGGYRGAERILYSNDGLIYYTDDHYESFTQLY